MSVQASEYGRAWTVLVASAGEANGNSPARTSRSPVNEARRWRGTARSATGDPSSGAPFPGVLRRIVGCEDAPNRYNGIKSALQLVGQRAIGIRTPRSLATAIARS